MPRNFATLEPLELQLPLIGIIEYHFIVQHRADDRPNSASRFIAKS
jgi:hypothetical protein